VTKVLLDVGLPRRAAEDLRRAPSVIHFRLSNLDRLATVRWLSRILPLLEEDLSKGCIASVGPTGIRVRSLPLVVRGQSGG
jgi:hypothetical protein